MTINELTEVLASNTKRYIKYNYQISCYGNSSKSLIRQVSAAENWKFKYYIVKCK